MKISRNIFVITDLYIQSVIGLGKYEEKLLLQQLEELSSVMKNNPAAKRLRRKLIIRKACKTLHFVKNKLLIGGNIYITNYS